MPETHILCKGRNMKKIVSLILLLLLTMLSSCGEAVTVPDSHESETAAVTLSAESTSETEVSPVPEGFTEDDAFIGDRGRFELSEKNNVIVFIVDRFDRNVAGWFFNGFPEWTSHGLRDFTFFSNCIGSYSRTMPSLCYLLTGFKDDYTLPCNEYFETAWKEGSFLKDLKNAGIVSKIYSEEEYVFGDAANVIGLIDNVSYSYASDSPHETNDLTFWNDYRNTSLQTENESEGQFILYHLSGCHEPFRLGENGFAETGRGNSNSQAIGDMVMIFDYIQQMKELGIYDSSTIIITADHGFTGNYNELDSERLITLLVKPRDTTYISMHYSEKPLTHDNIRASIISFFDLDSSSYGKTFYEVSDYDTSPRYFYMQSTGSETDLSHRDIDTVTYEITGDANDFGNWKIISRERMKYPFYDAYDDDPH